MSNGYIDSRAYWARRTIATPNTTAAGTTTNTTTKARVESDLDFDLRSFRSADWICDWMLSCVFIPKHTGRQPKSTEKKTARHKGTAPGDQNTETILPNYTAFSYIKPHSV